MIIPSWISQVTNDQEIDVSIDIEETIQLMDASLFSLTKNSKSKCQKVTK